MKLADSIQNPVQVPPGHRLVTRCLKKTALKVQYYTVWCLRWTSITLCVLLGSNKISLKDKQETYVFCCSKLIFVTPVSHIPFLCNGSEDTLQPRHTWLSSSAVGSILISVCVNADPFRSPLKGCMWPLIVVFWPTWFSNVNKWALKLVIKIKQ